VNTPGERLARWGRTALGRSQRGENVSEPSWRKSAPTVRGDSKDLAAALSRAFQEVSGELPARAASPSPVRPAQDPEPAAAEPATALTTDIVDAITLAVDDSISALLPGLVEDALARALPKALDEAIAGALGLRDRQPSDDRSRVPRDLHQTRSA
jgi:hypothetical protein